MFEYIAVPVSGREAQEALPGPSGALGGRGAINKVPEVYI